MGTAESLKSVRLLDFSRKAGGSLQTICQGKDNFYLYLKEQSFILLSPEGNILDRYSPSGESSSLLSTCISDLDNDGNDKLLFISGERGAAFGDSLVILDFDDGFREIYRQSFPLLNPWKVQTADVDGDDRKEISLGVYKESPFHQVLAKRPFLYEWHNHELVPKWLGSRLSRPFEDYVFADLDGNGREELIAIELLESGEKVLHVYSWKGFGFEGLGESPSFADIHSIYISWDDDTPLVQAQVKTGRKTNQKSFYFDGTQLTVSPGN
ncbi:MAG: hypothetical protein Q7J85_14415 [Bacillota bacterium]|nr:hypothetical protein [Bacillota bacterium]